MARIVHVHDGALVHTSRDFKEARHTVARGHASSIEFIGRLLPGLAAQDTNPDGFPITRLYMPFSGLPRGKPLALIKLWGMYRAYSRALVRAKPDIVHCHSLGPLAAAVAACRATGARLLYDAHELETERNGLKGAAKFVDRLLEQRLIRRCDAVVVVCDSIADWYVERYGIERPVVVRNIPEVRGGAPIVRDRQLWRSKFHIPDEHIIFIYQGALFEGRRIEQLLRVFARTRPDRHLVFMGYGEMEGMVRSAAERHANIHYSPAVKPDDVLRHTAGADVGLVGVENVCLSYYYSLPNKLFEFLLAGIPALMPNYPEMVRLAGGSGCGWVVGESDEDWLRAVDSLTPAQVAAGKAAARTLGESLSWSGEAEKLGAVYKRLSVPMGLRS